MLDLYAHIRNQDELITELKDIFGDNFEINEFNFVRIKSPDYNAWISDNELIIYNIAKEKVSFSIPLEKISTLFKF